jgi:hypothetical protein
MMILLLEATCSVDLFRVKIPSIITESSSHASEGATTSMHLRVYFDITEEKQDIRYEGFTPRRILKVKSCNFLTTRRSITASDDDASSNMFCTVFIQRENISDIYIYIYIAIT